MAAHRAVLDALLDVPGVSRARLVHHAAFGGRDRVLVEVGPEAAADAARQGAHRQSAEILRLVLEGPLALPDHLAARLWTERSYSSYVVNRFEAAFTCAETAVALADRTTDRRDADGRAVGAGSGGHVRAGAGGGARGGRSGPSSWRVTRGTRSTCRPP